MHWRWQKIGSLVAECLLADSHSLEQHLSYASMSCLQPGLDWTRLFMSLTAGAGTRCMRFRIYLLVGWTGGVCRQHLASLAFSWLLFVSAVIWFLIWSLFCYLRFLSSNDSWFHLFINISFSIIPWQVSSVQHERCNDFLSVTSLVSQKLSHPWLRGSQRPDNKTLSTFPSLSRLFYSISFP